MLYVGDDWAEDHHDVEIEDATGRRLAKARLPEGIAGMARLHALIAEHLPAHRRGVGGGESQQVVIGIETDRGPWVQALIAAGYRVYRDQPAAGGPVPGAAFQLRRQERRRRCAHVGRHGPHRSATSCARSPATPERPRRSRWWRGRIRP